MRLLETPLLDLELPELWPYKTLKFQERHRSSGVFVAEGELCVIRLIESGWGIRSVLAPTDWIAERRDWIAAQPGGELRVYTADRVLLETLTGFDYYQGLLAVGELPPPVQLGELLDRRKGPRLLMAAEELANAENLGGLIRNCAAFGVSGLVTGETCCSPFLRRATRASMGTLFRVPIVESPHLQSALLFMRESGIRCLAAHPRPDSPAPWDLDLTGDVCLVVGSEGNGLSPAIVEACDGVVGIPMASGVDSLNVNTAGGVLLYEAARQRRTRSV